MTIEAARQTQTVGAQVAQWLRERIDPARIYDHRTLHELEPIGVHYDDRAHVLTLDSGEIADVPTYSPAELVRHPLVEVYGIADLGPEARSTLGYEFAAALHALMWPTETPPGRPEVNYAQSFEDNVASIAARDGLPYRDAPPGGWWR